MRDRGL